MPTHRGRKTVLATSHCGIRMNGKQSPDNPRQLGRGDRNAGCASEPGNANYNSRQEGYDENGYKEMPTILREIKEFIPQGTVLILHIIPVSDVITEKEVAIKQ